MKISELQVLQSAAGFYIGRLCDDPEIGCFEVLLPYSRDSEYFITKEQAEAYLKHDLN